LHGRSVRRREAQTGRAGRLPAGRRAVQTAQADGKGAIAGPARPTGLDRDLPAHHPAQWPNLPSKGPGVVAPRPCPGPWHAPRGTSPERPRTSAGDGPANMAFCPFGGGVIGNTTGSGPVVGGSSPPPRATLTEQSPRSEAWGFCMRGPPRAPLDLACPPRRKSSYSTSPCSDPSLGSSQGRWKVLTYSGPRPGCDLEGPVRHRDWMYRERHGRPGCFRPPRLGS
jgi:hypothetical protein